MTIRENAKYAVVAPTSMGVRITPVNRQTVYSGNMFSMQATSAESNVLSISAGLGKKTKVLTTFVSGSPIAQFIKADLGRRGMEYEGAEVEQGGPWGYRHQFNIADSGFGLRAPRVCNDRAGEVGRTLSIADFDTERLFAVDGVKVLHVSGLICALSPETGKFCLELVKVAKQNGTLVSFDLNYRASFWKNRESELSAIFSEIASKADVLIGNEEDFQLCLGFKGPDAGGVSISEKIESFKAMIGRVKQKYSNASVFATTLREVVSANEHKWGAIMLCDDEWTVIEPKPICVLDRIGGGDAFVGGLLYGIISGWSGRDACSFGWACGAFVVTLETDFGLPMDEKQIWDIWKGNARVQR